MVAFKGHHPLGNFVAATLETSKYSSSSSSPIDVALHDLASAAQLSFFTVGHMHMSDRLGKHQNGSSLACAKVCFRNNFNGLVLHPRELFPNTDVIRRHAEPSM